MRSVPVPGFLYSSHLKMLPANLHLQEHYLDFRLFRLICYYHEKANEKVDSWELEKEIQLSNILLMVCTC